MLTMRLLVSLLTIIGLLATAPVYADAAIGAARVAAKDRASSAFTTFSRNAPAHVMTYLVNKHPEVFRSIDRKNAENCLSERQPAQVIDASCRAALQQFIATIRSLLSTSYGLTRSMGRFDPTTVSYSRGLTRRLLRLDPQGKI